LQVSVEVRLPKKGEYGLEIFANDPDKDGDMFTHVCQYLTFYSDGKAKDLYGKPPDKETEAAAGEITPTELEGAETPETGD